MLFNTFEFAIFFVLVYALYIILRHRYQNYFLLVASYAFYGSWDWRFLSLILISTLVDYWAGLGIYHSVSRRQKMVFLWVSIATNLGILGTFKYFGFFSESLISLLSAFGISVQWHFIQIILPVGISFYTFQTMSYTIDIYREKLTPTRNLPNFALFVAFFPQLVAGPIERAVRLLPQVENERSITYKNLQVGIWLLLRGFFKKVVVADNLAYFTQFVFESPEKAQGILVLLGIYAFAFQIYGDFSGYSDIARGLGKLLGFDLMVNFRMPYLSTNPQEFWTRWHISLSTWLRDYLYIPLGGNRNGRLMTYRNLILTMLLGGLWHGAAWNFVVWGLFHGILLSIHRLFLSRKSRKDAKSKPKGKGLYLLRVFLFFHVTCFGWLIFAVRKLSDVPLLLKNLFSPFEWNGHLLLVTLLVFALPLVLWDILNERRGVENVIQTWEKPLRLAFCTFLVLLIVFCGAMTSREFIYFQF